MNKTDTRAWERLFSLQGERVQIPAYFDLWMMGDRYGEIVGYIKSRDVYRVKTDIAKKTVYVPAVELNIV